MNDQRHQTWNVDSLHLSPMATHCLPSGPRANKGNACLDIRLASAFLSCLLSVGDLLAFASLRPNLQNGTAIRTTGTYKIFQIRTASTIVGLVIKNGGSEHAGDWPVALVGNSADKSTSYSLTCPLRVSPLDVLDRFGSDNVRPMNQVRPVVAYGASCNTGAASRRTRSHRVSPFSPLYIGYHRNI